VRGPGSLERVASLLGNALGELADAFSDPGALLARLGVALDDDVLASAGAAVATVVAAARDLATATAALDVSIGANNTIGLTTNGAVVIDRLATVLTGLSGLHTAVIGTLGALSPAQQAKAAGLLADLPGRVLSLMVVDGLRARMPSLTAGLALAGLIEARDVPGDDTDATFPAHVAWSVHWDRIGRVLADPLSLPREAYGFGAPGFDGTALLEVLARLTDTGDDRQARPYVTIGSGGIGTVLQAPTFVVGVAGTDLVFPQRFGVAAATTREVELGDRVTATLRVSGQVPSGSELRLSPSLHVTITPPVGTANLTASVTVTAGKAGEPVTVIGLTGVAGLSVETVSVTASLTAGWAGGAASGDLAVGVSFGGGRLDLDLSEAGGLLRSLLPKDALAAAFDLGLDLSGGTIRLRGGTGLSATFPVNMSLGPVEVQSVTVGLAAAAGSGLPVELSATLRTMLGPLEILVDRIGLRALLDTPAGGGNLGPLRLAGEFQPPTGLGVDLDTGPVQGGGYLAIEPVDRYAGVLRFKLTFIGVTAFGIYEEAPGGTAAFVAVLGIRFWPGIQLGFGFALTGVGGLVGLNRRANVDLLRERLASGAAGDVLFCEDPVKNAPAILGDLSTFFPPPGGFLVGPTLQISWLAPIVRIDLGILIEFPGPSKIVILGSFRAMIGLNETSALLYLRMDVLGIVDFEKRLISIDAQLVGSSALGVFRLTGGMAFRLGYDNNPYVLLSIGGFHPRFDPGPLNIPKLPRVGASLDVNVVVSIYVRLELYVAFTSNTFQAGAKVEAGLDIGPLSAHGYFYFDALIQFRPFHFELDFGAGFAVEVFGSSFCSVDISGKISGPGPIVIHAEGSVRKLFLKVSGSATFELGDHNADHPDPIDSPVRELEPELSQTANLRTEGDDPGVVLRPDRPPVQGILVSPKGSLIWEQKRAPLNTIIHRLGGVPLVGEHELRLDRPPDWTTSDELDWFNPGSFTDFDLQLSQTFNNATFQELPSGLRFGSKLDTKAADVVPHTDEIVVVKRPTKTRFSDLKVGSYITEPLNSAFRDRLTTPAVDPGDKKVSVKPETADVHAGDGTLLHSGQAPFQAFQISRKQNGAFSVPTGDVPVNL
jgi:hypothetical protein